MYLCNVQFLVICAYGNFSSTILHISVFYISFFIFAGFYTRKEIGWEVSFSLPLLLWICCLHIYYQYIFSSNLIQVLTVCVILLLLLFFPHSISLSLPRPLSQNLNITVKEVNQALDLESKKFLEAKKRDQQNLVTLSRIKNGIAVLQGERLSSTESPSHSPSSTPSPSATIVQEGEDAATANPSEQASAPTQEQDSADKENLRASRGKEIRLTKNVREPLLPPPPCQSFPCFLLPSVVL